MLTEEETTVLIAVYYVCNRSTHANTSIHRIQAKIPQEARQVIRTWKILKRLEKKGLIWFHYGRRANSGRTVGITKEGIKTLKKINLI